MSVLPELEFSAAFDCVDRLILHEVLELQFGWPITASRLLSDDFLKNCLHALLVPTPQSTSTSFFVYIKDPYLAPVCLSYTSQSLFTLLLNMESVCTYNDTQLCNTLSLSKIYR